MTLPRPVAWGHALVGCLTKEVSVERIGDELVERVAGSIEPLDQAAWTEAVAQNAALTKPAGALGRLEELGLALAAMAGVCPPPVPKRATVVVAAGDHGVHARGVTPWPQRVTAQMVANVGAGGAAVNVLARQVRAEVIVLDVGVASAVSLSDNVLSRRVRAGTSDLSSEPAMSRTQALMALRVGVETARELIAAGTDCLLTGDMGIANTTASAALIAAFTGAPPTEVTGRGTGVDDDTWRRKIEVIETALTLHRPRSDDPIGVLACLGGLEHAALAGLILATAGTRTPVILDGVIASAAALVAQRIQPLAIDYCIAGHLSAEAGHSHALARLGLASLLDLGLRLGEGTGAVLALPLVRSAAALLGEMATFESAGVSRRG